MTKFRALLSWVLSVTNFIGWRNDDDTWLYGLNYVLNDEVECTESLDYTLWNQLQHEDAQHNKRGDL